MNPRPVARGLRLALSRIADDGSYFARASDIRLWRVDAKGVPADVWPRVAEALERQPGTRELFLHVDEPFGPAIDGFERCARGLVAAWQRRSWGPNGAAPALDSVELPAVELAVGGPPRQTLARAVRSIARAVRAPHEGVVVMLAPRAQASHPALDAALAAFVASPALANVRWVLVRDGDASRASSGALGSASGAALLATDARVPEDDFADGFEAVSMPIDEPRDSRPLDLAPPRLSSVPPSSPKSGIVPRRISVPPPPPGPRAEELAAAGIPPELLVGGSASRLRRCLLEAANAARRSRLSDAVQWQKQACEATARLGMIEANLGARMVLAAYLEAGRRPEHALREYLDTAELALARGCDATAADAFARAGHLAHRAARYDEAGGAYARAAELARRADLPELQHELGVLGERLLSDAGTEARSAVTAR